MKGQYEHNGFIYIHGVTATPEQVAEAVTSARNEAQSMTILELFQWETKWNALAEQSPWNEMSVKMWQMYQDELIKRMSISWGHNADARI